MSEPVVDSRAEMERAPCNPGARAFVRLLAARFERVGLSRWKIVARLVAVLFLASAGAKALSGSESIGDNPLLREYPWLSSWLVQVEILLAVLLILGVFPTSVWRGTTFAFSALAGVSLGEWVLGFGSCGCFGDLAVNPLVTFLADVAIFVLLVWARPIGAVMLSPRGGLARAWRHPAGWFGCQALVFSSMLIVVGYGNDLVVAADSQRALLANPANWKGLEFPLLPYVDVSSRLQEGRWKAIVFRRGCGKCESLLREVAHEQRDPSQDVVVIEVPPYAVGFKADRSFLYGRLTDTERWRMRTPLTVQLIDGRVESIE
jgi:hypothetical protein